MQSVNVNRGKHVTANISRISAPHNLVASCLQITFDALRWEFSAICSIERLLRANPQIKYMFAWSGGVISRGSCAATGAGRFPGNQWRPIRAGKPVAQFVSLQGAHAL